MADASLNPPSAVETIAACPHCGSSMPATAAFCPGCGCSMKRLPAAERLAAAIGYFTFVPGAVLLLLPAFRNKGYVRFHAWQSVLLWGVFFLGSLAALFLSNVAAAIVCLLLGILASLAMFFLWIILSLKAWHGERFELPVFGTLAGRLR